MIIPALLVVMLAILTFGMWFFSVGRAAIFSTEAQTAADAAALAAVKDVRTQLMEQVALTGTSDLALINPLRVRAAAESYAQRNKAHVTRLERRGVDVKVWVSTNAKLGERAEELGPGGHARRGPRPRSPGPDRGARVRRRQHRRDRHRRDQEDLRQGLEGARRGHRRARRSAGRTPPPTTSSSSPSCSRRTASPSPRTPTSATTRSPGTTPTPATTTSAATPPRSTSTSTARPEKPAIDGIVNEVQALGFRTIWQAAGHYDHIHIDLANSGSHGCRRRHRRGGRRARGDDARGQADRLGRRRT